MSLWNGFDISEYWDEKQCRFKEDVTILALDFGHGQCSMAQLKADRTIKDWVFDDEAYTIPTAIRYEGNEIKIGRQAAGKEDTIYYFKDSPKHFDDVLWGRTKRDLMGDFLGQLMRMAAERNGGVSRRAKVLLFVGCPSSEEEWLSVKFQYAAMIEDAVRRYIPKIKAVILPESRAACIHAMQNGDLSMDAGVLVLDFGSSTADATWLKTGEKALERSWRLGASEIENAMIKEILEREGYDMGFLTLQQKALYQFDFRERKERFYNEIPTSSTVIQIFCLDKDGNPVKTINPHTKKQVNATAAVIPVNVDDEFMDAVVGSFGAGRSPHTGREFALRGSGKSAAWAGHCRRIIRTILQELKDSGRKCQAIVLTGGASKMQFIRELCKEEAGRVYNSKKIRVEIAVNPSLTVSRGLAEAAKQDMQAEEMKSEVIARLKEQIEKELEEFAAYLSKEIGQIYYKRELKILEAWADDSVTSPGERNCMTVKNRLKNQSIDRKTIENLAKEGFKNTVGCCRKRIQQTTNEALEKIYHNKLDEKSYRLDEKKWKRIMKHYDSDKLNQLEFPDIDGCGLLDYIFIILIGVPLAFLDGIFDTEMSDALLAHYETRELSLGKRKKLLEDAKENHLNKLTKEVEQRLLKNIEESREKGALNLEETIASELETAFDLMAFYG